MFSFFFSNIFFFFFLNCDLCIRWQVRHIIFLLCQFVNYMEVTQLPTYYPSQQEKDDPKLYASNVRRLMASEVCNSFNNEYIL